MVKFYSSTNFEAMSAQEGASSDTPFARHIPLHWLPAHHRSTARVLRPDTYETREFDS